MRFAEMAAATLAVLPVITSTSSVALDEDIAAFKLSDLSRDETEAAINEVVMERARKLGSSHLQCHAFNFFHHPTKKRRCSGAPTKGTNLCYRHSISLAAEKVIYYVDAEDTKAVK